MNGLSRNKSPRDAMKIAELDRSKISPVLAKDVVAPLAAVFGSPVERHATRDMNGPESHIG